RHGDLTAARGDRTVGRYADRDREVKLGAAARVAGDGRAAGGRLAGNGNRLEDYLTQSSKLVLLLVFIPLLIAQPFSYR
ncbi:MAG TPA: hypothetical protein H9816_07810, partial [Candidatus Tidjanibacter faecipullorum]|nr:hypothetical protein [Candidatus Tidjanibacter faecipullorum]